jgi:hypothetical protein
LTAIGSLSLHRCNTKHSWSALFTAVLSSPQCSHHRSALITAALSSLQRSHHCSALITAALSSLQRDYHCSALITAARLSLQASTNSSLKLPGFGFQPKESFQPHSAHLQLSDFRIQPSDISLKFRPPRGPVPSLPSCRYHLLNLRLQAHASVPIQTTSALMVF